MHYPPPTISLPRVHIMMSPSLIRSSGEIIWFSLSSGLSTFRTCPRVCLFWCSNVPCLVTNARKSCPSIGPDLAPEICRIRASSRRRPRGESDSSWTQPSVRSCPYIIKRRPDLSFAVFWRGAGPRRPVSMLFIQSFKAAYQFGKQSGWPYLPVSTTTPSWDIKYTPCLVFIIHCKNINSIIDT